MSENFLEPRYATRAPLPGTRGFKQFDKLDIVLTRDSNPLVTPELTSTNLVKLVLVS